MMTRKHKRNDEKRRENSVGAGGEKQKHLSHEKDIS